MNVSIVIGCHGPVEWADLAWSRAYPSTLGQGGREALVSYLKDGTLAQARNAGAAAAQGDWLLFLDADDELAPGYVTAMRDKCAIATQSTQEIPAKVLLTPQVQYVVGGAKADPKFWPECDIRDGNWMVIGTMISRRLFDRIGGFHEWPIYEDWCLWQRAMQQGAVPVKVPQAVYVAHVGANSRNRQKLRADERTRIHHEIRQANYPSLY